MTENDAQSAPQCATAQELLKGATPEQRKWVMARIAATSDLAAARIIGMDRHTVARWSNKSKLDQAVAALLAEPQSAALAIIQEAVTEAARLKVAGLKSRKEPIAQAAATEILDRVLGKALQQTQVSGPGGGALPVEVIVKKLRNVSSDDV